MNENIELRRRPALMADVAKLAGVSNQTVSRVINASEHVRAETRTRVLEAFDRFERERHRRRDAAAEQM